MTTKENIITSVEFGEPPVRERDIMQKVPDLLRAKPNRWAKVRTGLERDNAQRIASRVNKGHMAKFPKADFEAIARLSTKGDGWDLWMRFTPD